MAFESEGTLVTDEREIAISDGWDSQTEWEAYQNISGIEITDGIVQLAEAPEYPTSISHRWRFSEGSGSTAEDIVGSLDMTIDGLSWVNGTYVGDNALESTGNDYGSITMPEVLDGDSLTEFSIATTVETTDSNSALLGSFIGGGQNLLLGIGIVNGSSGGELSFRLDDENNSQFQAYSNDSVNDGNKYRVVVTKGSNNASDIRLWINGSEAVKNVPTDQGLNSYQEWNQDFYFFCQNDEGSPRSEYTGILDNPAIYSTELTEEEVLDDYNEQPWV